MARTIRDGGGNDPAKDFVASASDRTVAGNIEHALALSILSGERGPGSRLPSVRDLAQQYDVTVPTVQRALDRLGSMGLVTAKRGSGITVEDPRRNMNLSLIPLWFEALSGKPDKAAKILKDFLALRRLITAHLFQTASAQLLGALPALLPLALKLSTSKDLLEIARADAELTRTVVERADNFALSAVFHTVETMALEVPYIAEALYADREAHKAVIGQAIASFGKPNRSDAAQALQEALERWDDHTVERYVELLSRSKQEKGS